MKRKFSWNQPCCERCWVRSIGYRDGQLINPSRVKDIVDPLHCAFCGGLTWVGIFVRRDPSTVLFPAEEESE